MKIICVGRNYVDHIKELSNERPENPVIFFKLDTSMLIRNRPFFYPEYSNDIHYEVEILIKICKVGKTIPEKFANTYYEEIGLGVDFTARDLQSYAKENRLPWGLAKGFDSSAIISPFVPKSNFENVQDISFSLKKNDEVVQLGETKKMIYTVDYLISYISKYITLKKGDIIFTGTPKGVGPVQIGDQLEGFIGDEKMFSCAIK